MNSRLCGLRQQNVKFMPYYLVIKDVLKPTLNLDKLLAILDHF